MHKVSVREARERISQLLAAVSAGEEVVITRHGKPTARLVAIDAAQPSIAFPDRRAFRFRQPEASQSSAELIRKLRDERG